MSANWYDVLGVTPEATTDEIRAAWRSATDSFGPGSAQFGLFNEAAGVLLDADKRRAYDESLPAKEVEAEPVAAAAPEPVQASAEETVDVVTSPTTRVGRLVAAASSVFGLSLLAVLAIASVVLAVVLGIKVQHRADVANAGPEASSLAEKAVVAALSYDYRNMTATHDAAVGFMTPGYKADYDKVFNGLLNGPIPQSDGTVYKGGVQSLKAIVTATTLSTAVVDADRNKVRVLVFLNQDHIVNGVKKGTLANRVVATMVHQDGRWLLDHLDPLGAGF